MDCRAKSPRSQLASGTMTDREAPPEGDLSEWLIDQRGDTAVDEWADPDGWGDPDGLVPWDEWAGWDDYRIADAQPPAGPPWYRRPGLILALIVTAATALVVALALLIAGDGLGRTQDAPLPIRLSPPAPTPLPTPSGTPSADPAPPVEARPEPSPTEPPESDPGLQGTTEAPVPVGEAPSAAAERGTQDSPGPRINVTRAPMSFRPGSTGN